MVASGKHWNPQRLDVGKESLKTKGNSYDICLETKIPDKDA